MGPTQFRFKTTIVPGPCLSCQTWWPDLHSMINAAFLNKNYSVFPPTWTRLDPDATKGAEGLQNELGEAGYMCVIFDESDQRPVACGGVLPFRGEDWINHAGETSDYDLANQIVSQEWEICCFCVRPDARSQGLSRLLLDELLALIRPLGGKKLYTNYAIDETGDFWPKAGFEVIPEAGGTLHKGFMTDPDKEGLRADIHFNMGVRNV